MARERMLRFQRYSKDTIWGRLAILISFYFVTNLLEYKCAKKITKTELGLTKLLQK